MGTEREGAGARPVAGYFLTGTDSVLQDFHRGRPLHRTLASHVSFSQPLTEMIIRTSLHNHVLGMRKEFTLSTIQLPPPPPSARGETHPRLPNRQGIRKGPERRSPPSAPQLPPHSLLLLGLHLWFPRHCSFSLPTSLVSFTDLGQITEPHGTSSNVRSWGCCCH